MLFLYEVIIGRKLAWMHNVVRAQRPARLPVVLSREEVALVLEQLRGPAWLMASFMYGAGLRLQECVELRVKDVSFDRCELTIRDGKGGKDRVTMLPAALRGALANHLARVKARHDADLVAGRGSVALPGALRAKYPNAPREWGWQWVFPATRFYVDRATGNGGGTICMRRSSSERSKRRSEPPGFRAQPHVIHCVIHLRRICSRRVTTFGPFRNCWGIGM